MNEVINPISPRDVPFRVTTCRRSHCNNPKSFEVGHYGRCVQCHQAAERERLEKETRRIAREAAREQRRHDEALRVQMKENREKRVVIDRILRHIEDYKNRYPEDNLEIITRYLMEEITKKEIKKQMKKNREKRVVIDRILRHIEYYKKRYPEDTLEMLTSCLMGEINTGMHTGQGEHECSVCMESTSTLTSCGHPLCNSCKRKIVWRLYSRCPICRENF